MDVILNTQSYPGKLHATINHLADHFADLAGFHHDPVSPTATATGTEIQLSSGTALSPYDAANCLRDTRRTTAFLQGIHQALRDLLENQKDRPVHVIYAGCGPFATLLTPLLHRFNPSDIQILLLDIQPECISSAHRLIESLGHSDFLEDCLVADAATWRNNTGHPFQLLITETMQAALAKECHVAIAANLSAVLDTSGIMIPERIRLNAVLLDPTWEFSVERMSQSTSRNDHIPLGTVFDFDLQTAISINQSHGPDFTANAPIRCARLQIPLEKSSTHEIWITTTITTYGDASIGIRDSGLTIPRPAEIGPTPGGGEWLSFSYLLGPTPQLEVREIGAN